MRASRSDGPSADEQVASGQAWSEFCSSLAEAGRVILADDLPLDPLDRSEGYRYLSRLVRAGLEGCLEHADPQAPELLRLCHETVKMGADNPDNVYLSAPLHPDYEYRVVGTRGSVHYLGIGTYDGGYGASGSMPPAGYVTLDRETQDVELLISRQLQRSAGLQLPMGDRTRSLVVRQTFLDRRSEEPARLRIERVDGPHIAQELTPLRLVRGLRNAARFVRGCSELFATWTRNLARTPNQLPLFEPAVAAAAGGAEDITYFHGYWQLGEDEALVIELRPPVCEYWNFQLNNHWLESLDYRYHQITLNRHSARAAADGSVRLIVAHRDPGLGNWIDTCAHRRGTMSLRWVRAASLEDARAALPSTRVVSWGELRGAHAAAR